MNSVSVYTGPLTPVCIAKNVKRMQDAFPALPKGFYSILGEMIREDGFSDSRLEDAVKHTIRNCTYPTPTLAQVLSFDKRVRLHSYPAVCMMVTCDGYTFEDFIKREVNNQMFWILKSEAIQKGLL
jgi:hypothetical protein